jgi:fumarate reductase flavoprotein subunit
MKSSEITENVELKADVVIIGGGASGLSAAVSAAEAGAKNVIVLEKAKTTGGNGMVSAGFFAVESPTQKRLGVNVTRDEMFQRFMAFTQWKSDPKLVRAWVNKSGEIAAWLEGKGVKVTLGDMMGKEEEGTMRWHMLWEGEGKPPGMVGKAIVEALTGDCRRLGVKVLLGTAASRILTDKKHTMTGVTATAGGKEFEITASSVIISTGGFARNKKMMKKYFPAYREDMFTHSLPQMTGDGLVMAEEAGAVIDEASIVCIFFGPHHYAWNNHLTYLHRVPEMVHVNKKGERYSDESLDGNSKTNALNRQTDCISYTLFDMKMKRDIVEKRRIAGPFTEDVATRDNWLEIIENDIKKEVANGRIKIADSWDEIARFIGAKPEVLKAEVERYNSFCDAGYDADFLKDSQCLWPLRTPPYYAIISAQGYDVSNGGIKINHRMEVLNKRNDSISGLYAVGNDAAVHYGSYTGAAGAPGCDFSFALCSGYMAGENATKYVLASRK